MGNELRGAYRPLAESEAKTLSDFKDQTQALYDRIDQTPVEIGRSERGRQLALAKTKLEESVMWYTKALTGPVTT